MENLRLNAVVHTLTSGAWEEEAGRFIVLTRKADFIRFVSGLLPISCPHLIKIEEVSGKV